MKRLAFINLVLIACLGAVNRPPAPVPRHGHPGLTPHDLAVAAQGIKELFDMCAQMRVVDWSQSVDDDNPRDFDGPVVVDSPLVMAQAPAPTEPTPTPEPSPAGPTLKIKVTPPQGTLGHAIHIELEETGAIRERDVTVVPVPSDGDFFPHASDPRRFAFVGEVGIYTIKAIVIGEKKGYAEQEVRVEIRDPRPQPPSKTEQPTQPEELVRQWASQVNSANRQAEASEIAKAARATSEKLKSRQIGAERAIDEWGTSAYLRIGNSFAVWQGFFGHMRELYAENSRLKDSNPTAFLESLAEILEGR